MTTEHVCIHESKLGKLAEAIDARKEESAEIKGQIHSLVTMITATQLEQNKQNSELKQDIVAITTMLTAEKERREELAKEVKSHGEMLSTLNTNMSLALQGINSLKNMFAESESKHDKKHDNFDKRIRYLEKVAWAVYAAIIGVIALGSIVAWYGSTMSNYKMLHTPQVIKEVIGDK